MALRRALILLSIVLACAPAAPAQERAIPEGAKRGYVRHAQEMLVSVDGKRIRLAPGATIRDQRNLAIVPVSIPREGAWAAFILDRNGQISRVWLLTPEELARPRKQPSGG